MGLSEHDAGSVADAVGDLPLAVAQAAGYLAETQDADQAVCRAPADPGGGTAGRGEAAVVPGHTGGGDSAGV